MKDEEDFVFFRMGRSAKTKNKEIFQRILEAAQDKPVDECWAETQSEVKLNRNPVIERFSPQPQTSQDPSNPDRIKISHSETEQSAVWQIEVDKEAAKTLDYMFDGFTAFLTRLLSTA